MFAALLSLFRSQPVSHRGRLRLEALEDRAVPAVLANYAVIQNWGSGFQGQVTLLNNGAAAVPFSNLQFDLAAPVTSISDAKIVSHTGNHYTVTNAGYNASIPAGNSVSFGFVASQSSSTAASNFILDGVALNPETPPPTIPPATNTVQATFSVTSDWGTGMQGAIAIRNKSASTATNWKVSFDFAGPINSIWNGTILSHVGNHYTVGPVSYNSSILAGGEVDVGFTAGVGGLTATNLVVTGGVSAVNHAPTAGANSANVIEGKTVQIAVLTNAADADGDQLTVSAVGAAAHGKVIINKDNTVTYTAAAGYVGIDTFTYRVSAGKGGISTGIVTVSVLPPLPKIPVWGIAISPFQGVGLTLDPTLIALDKALLTL